jgi:hypothetical protein
VGNQTDGGAYGGAIEIYNATAIVSKSTFENNAAGGGTLYGTYGYGGAIWVANNASLTIESDRFTNNKAGGDGYGYGGAIFGEGPITGTKNTFTGNKAYGNGVNETDAFGFGGAIETESNLTLSNSTFDSNQAYGHNDAGYAYGGAIDVETEGGSAFKLNGVSFTNNAAHGGSVSDGYAYGGGSKSTVRSTRR